jgi:O-methyltransferase
VKLNTDQHAERYLTLLENCLTASIYDESGWEPVEELQMNGQLMKFPPGLILVKETPFQPEARAEGRDWPLFAYTMVGAKRLANVRRCVEQVLRNDVPGDLFETGVWRGGCSIYMRALLQVHGVTDRSVWLADSFEGMPKPGPIDQAVGGQRDLSEEKYLKCSVESVQANFQRFGLLDGQVKFLKGWFNESLPKAAVKTIAVLRLDADLYHSTRDALDSLYGKLSPGGFVIVDDYYAWEGCRRAVDEFRAERKIDAAIEPIDWTGAFWRVGGATAETPPAAQAR